jgi:hypothetical protein
LENPGEILEECRDETGQVVLPSIGDKLLDRFERQLAAGQVPDLEEGMSKEQKEKLRREREQFSKARKQAEDLDVPDEIDGQVLGQGKRR